MPLYTYQCEICDAIEDDYNTVSARHDAPECKVCGHSTVLKIMPTQIQPVLGGGDFQGYMCPVTDKWITSRRTRKNIMAEHDLIEVGDRKPLSERLG